MERLCFGMHVSQQPNYSRSLLRLNSHLYSLCHIDDVTQFYYCLVENDSDEVQMRWNSTNTRTVSRLYNVRYEM